MLWLIMQFNLVVRDKDSVVDGGRALERNLERKAVEQQMQVDPWLPS